MKSEQEVFDTVVLHLLKQEAKAEGEDGECLYRDPEGRKCAVGCLIPDEQYRDHMEGKGLLMVSILKALKANRVLAVSDYTLADPSYAGDQNIPVARLTTVGKLLRNLQWIHDNEDPKVWAACFRTLGSAFDLDTEGL